jgi:hypothetical protein
MKWSLVPVVVVGFALGVGGCQNNKRDVVTLDRSDASSELDKLVAAPEKGTYYLYSSRDGDKAVYHTDLKRGEELGFHVHGDRATAIAKGIRVELSDFNEGATYVWKVEEEKKK